eukprot:6459744-Amphidinium_carterae.1
MDELLELFAAPAVGQKRPRDDDNNDDDDELNRGTRCSVQPAVDEMMNSTTWAVRLRGFFQHRLPGQQARQIVVDSACSGMCSHSMALQDRSRDVQEQQQFKNRRYKIMFSCCLRHRREEINLVNFIERMSVDKKPAAIRFTLDHFANSNGCHFGDIHDVVAAFRSNADTPLELRATCLSQASRVAHSHGQELAVGVKVGGAEGCRRGRVKAKQNGNCSESIDVLNCGCLLACSWTTHEHAPTMWATLEWLRIAQPKTAVLENVTGIKAVERGADCSPLDVILNEVATFGYAAISVDINLASWHDMKRGRDGKQESHGNNTFVSSLPGWPSMLASLPIITKSLRVVRVYMLLIHNDHGGHAAIDEAATMFKEAIQVMHSRPQVSKEDLLLPEDDPRVQEQLDQIKALSKFTWGGHDVLCKAFCALLFPVSHDAQADDNPPSPIHTHTHAHKHTYRGISKKRKCRTFKTQVAMVATVSSPGSSG